MNHKAFFSIMTFVLAGFGIGCGAEFEGGADEEAVDSTQQAVASDAMRLIFKVGSTGKPSSGRLVARFIRANGTFVEATIGQNQSWAAGSTKTVSTFMSNPEAVRSVQIWYDNGGSWQLSSIQADEMAAGSPTTPRYFLQVPAWTIAPALAPAIVLNLADVLIHEPATDPNDEHEDFFVSYLTWNGGHYCAQVRDNGFIHAPRLAAGCDWANKFTGSYIDYQTWNGDTWRATVNTGTKQFTHQKHPSGPSPHSSANLRYHNLDGSDWEMILK